jgi:hypothetical protein
VNDKRLLADNFGISNLLSFAGFLTRVPQPFVVKEGPEPVIINGREAFQLSIVSQRGLSSVTQTIFAFETERAYVEFVASTRDDDDSSNLAGCVKNVAFRK